MPADSQRIAVRQALRSANIQTKLRVSQPDDPLEREADEMADAVMRMADGGSIAAAQSRETDDAQLIQRQAEEEEEEEEEELIQPKGLDSYQNVAMPNILGDLAVLQGSPLADSERAFFEPRFGVDFSQVRIHRDARAAHLARSVSARAFTHGRDVVFGEGEYAPETHTGRQLLAHELAHVAQGGGGDNHTLLRRPDPTPAGQFVLASSEVGRRIRTGLVAESATLPGPTRDAPRVSQVNPDEVFEILESSPLFLAIAEQVNRLYFIDRSRTPELNFLFHLEPALGSEFQRPESRVVVQVSSLTEVVRGIVHEMVHARHRAPAVAAPTRQYGEVTRSEQAGVHEEAQTRLQERRIMAEIAGQEPWRTLTGGAAVERVPRRASELYGEVRGSFISGWPMLTYQEYFIIGAMKDNTRVTGIDERRAHAIARLLYDPMRDARAANATRFRLGKSDIAHYQRVAATPVPVRPPNVTQAMECARHYRANRSWQREFRTHNRLPTDARMPSACRAFIEGYQSPLWEGPVPYVPEWAYGLAMHYEPYERYQRFEFFANLLSRMRITYDTRVSAREEGDEISRWFESVPAENRGGALAYLEWLLIEETIAREWQRIGRPEPDGEVRRQHLDFLQARIGRPLRGISRSGLPRAP